MPPGLFIHHRDGWNWHRSWFLKVTIEDFRPGRYDGYRGGLHENRDGFVIACCIVHLSPEQTHAARCGPNVPHCNTCPGKVEDFKKQAKDKGAPVHEFLPDRSHVAEKRDEDWFIDAWNKGTPEWTQEIQDLCDDLCFPELSDVFRNELSSLTDTGRGSANATAGHTAQSHVERNEDTFVNVPSLTKHTPILQDYFVPMTNLGKHIGFLNEDLMDPRQLELFEREIHRKNLLQGLTVGQTNDRAPTVTCHCDGHNTVCRSGVGGDQVNGGFFVGKHTHLEQDRDALRKGIRDKFTLKTDSQIGFFKKACDDCVAREAKSLPVMKWIEDLCDQMPHERKQPASFASFTCGYDKVVEPNMLTRAASIDKLHFVAPFASAFHQCHMHFGFTEQQSAEMSFGCVWQTQPLKCMSCSSDLIENGLPENEDLAEHFSSHCQDVFGNSSSGPRPRTQVFANGDIAQEQKKSSIENVILPCREFNAMDVQTKRCR